MQKRLQTNSIIPTTIRFYPLEMTSTTATGIILAFLRVLYVVVVTLRMAVSNDAFPRVTIYNRMTGLWSSTIMADSAASYMAHHINGLFR